MMETPSTQNILFSSPSAAKYSTTTEITAAMIRIMRSSSHIASLNI